MGRDETVDPDWRRSACGRRDGGHAVVAGARADQCGACPIRLDCLRFAVRTGRHAGVWGGYAADELCRLVRRARHRRLLHAGRAPAPLPAPRAADPAA